ncbi:unnamed protein product [Prorocentrum cordatum]|uniref:U6 snRNA-associated Sm-like protein LSm1 n=1 Tax=Prorocentrum cordatum TaxID=2364126 RepID=A0ABN9SEI1_9DINO|nr:unnamed protein product [Polarella glacialis]
MWARVACVRGVLAGVAALRADCAGVWGPMRPTDVSQACAFRIHCGSCCGSSCERFIGAGAAWQSMEAAVFDGEAEEASDARKKLPPWASNLEDSVNKRLLIILRDDRKLFGWLRSFDQFANLLVEHTVERHILLEEKLYADVYLGTMLVRGENVCLFGEAAEDAPGEGPLHEAPLAYVLQREAEQEAAEQARGVRRPLDAFADPAEA